MIELNTVNLLTLILKQDLHNHGDKLIKRTHLVDLV